jgi:hypothetical protein
MKPQNQSPAYTVQSIALSLSLAHTTQISGPCISTKLTPLLHPTPALRRHAFLLPLLCSYDMVIQQRDNFISELDSGLRKVAILNVKVAITKNRADCYPYTLNVPLLDLALLTHK